MSVKIIHGDCLVELPRLRDEGFLAHAVVTDPPYHLNSIVKRFGKDNAAPAKHGTDGAFARSSRGFMGKTWDGGDVAFRPETWRAVYDCLLPGAHLLAFGGTRGAHRLACAIEDAGFEIRDSICWIYGSGFPKNHDVSKGIDKAAGAIRTIVGVTRGKGGQNLNQLARPDGNDSGAANGCGAFGYGAKQIGMDIAITAAATPEAAQWEGWGTALKPAHEPIIVARKPFKGSVAANVLRHGCGAVNIEASLVPNADNESLGRWPANVIHDGSDEVEAAFATFPTHGAGRARDKLVTRDYNATSYNMSGPTNMRRIGDAGSAARFFYTAKADAADRAGSNHPTVKPTDLMRYLVRLITPPGGTVLDPFAGTGSTGLAADQLGFNAVLIEQDETYAEDARRKVRGDAPLLSDVS